MYAVILVIITMKIENWFGLNLARGNNMGNKLTVFYYNAFYNGNDIFIEQGKGFDITDAIEDAAECAYPYAFTIEIEPSGDIRRISLEEEIAEYNTRPQYERLTGHEMGILGRRV